MLGKIADGIWDAATGKPDINELDRRLRRVEEGLTSKGAECATPVRELRERLSADMTKEEYVALENKYRQQVNERLNAVEADIQKLKTVTDQDRDQLKQLDRINERNDAALKRN